MRDQVSRLSFEIGNQGFVLDRVYDAEHHRAPDTTQRRVHEDRLVVDNPKLDALR